MSDKNKELKSQNIILTEMVDFFYDLCDEINVEFEDIPFRNCSVCDNFMHKGFEECRKCKTCTCELHEIYCFKCETLLCQNDSCNLFYNVKEMTDEICQDCKL